MDINVDTEILAVKSINKVKNASDMMMISKEKKVTKLHVQCVSKVYGFKSLSLEKLPRDNKNGF